MEPPKKQTSTFFFQRVDVYTNSENCWLLLAWGGDGTGRTQCFGTTSQDAAGWLYKEDGAHGCR